MKVVLRLDPSAFWSIIFFLMLLTLGINSQFCGVESLISGLVDNRPEFLRPRKFYFTIFMIVIMFLLGIPMVTNVRLA
jgi:solute carrier family 6 GABA transporter-like protein 1